MYILRAANTHIHIVNPLRPTANHRNTLQHTATHGNTRQHTATHGKTHGNTRQHTATHAPVCCSVLQSGGTRVCCSVLQSGGNSKSYLSTNEPLIPGL